MRLIASDSLLPQDPPETGGIGARAVRQLPSQPLASADLMLFLHLSWSHNIILMQKLPDLPTRFWYARQTAEQGWSRDRLTAEIKSNAHLRQGAAVTNFGNTLPDVHAELAAGLLKDPFLFDFLTLEEPFHERELETGLLTHIQKFLLELGRGFAFVGRQHHLEVSEKDFYLDLLFYHLKLRCFVVVDLKKGEFKPEYAGRMNFYCSVVDDQLRHAQDAATIGLILCQTKDKIIAEYALRDINKPIGVADYELTRALPENLVSSLPSIEDIEAELSQDLEKTQLSGKALAAGSSAPQTPAASALPLTEPVDSITLFITWTTYGTWLLGDSRGWRKWKRGEQQPQPLLEDWCRDQMKDKPLFLSGGQRETVEAIIRKHAEIRNWELHAVSVRSNHVHVAVTANAPPKRVRDQLKANGTTALRRMENPVTREKVWTKGGDIEFIDNDDDLEQVVIYITEAQDRMDRGK